MPKKKRKPKYIQFMVLRDDQHEPKNYKIRTILMRGLIGLLILIVLLGISGGVVYWRITSLALSNNRLREENSKLVKSLKQVDKLREELNKIKRFETQLRGSLSGYVKIENADQQDTTDLESINFENLNFARQYTIFRSIPSLAPVEGFMTRGFDPSSLFNEPHLGIDIAAPTGTPVKATADGVVVFSGWTVDGGSVLILKHGYGFISLYKHNERNLVIELERVRKGQVIALLGNTGKITTGAHLHFEIWRDGVPVNPEVYLTEGSINKS